MCYAEPTFEENQKSQLEHLLQSIHPSKLLCLYDCSAEKKQIFVGSKVTAGRDRGNDLFLSPNQRISRKHAVFLSRDDEKIDWIIQDCGSKNGTFLNDVKLVADIPYPIHQGDRINFAGESLFIVCDKSIEAAEKTEINYTCEYKEEKPAVDYNSSQFKFKQFNDDFKSGHLPPVSKPSQADIEECMEERKKLREEIEYEQMKPGYIEKLESNLKIPVEIEIWVNKVVDYYFSDLKYGLGLCYGIWAAEAKLYELKGYHWYSPSELHPAWLID